MASHSSVRCATRRPRSCALWAFAASRFLPDRCRSPGRRDNAAPARVRQPPSAWGMRAEQGAGPCVARKVMSDSDTSARAASSRGGAQIRRTGATSSAVPPFQLEMPTRAVRPSGWATRAIGRRSLLHGKHRHSPLRHGRTGAAHGTAGRRHPPQPRWRTAAARSTADRPPDRILLRVGLQPACIRRGERGR